MTTAIRDLHKSRELLYMLTWRDIRVRYKQSVMGFLWAILTPTLVVGASALIRVAMARFAGHGVTAQDLASVTVRGVAWSFFISALRFGTSSLVGNPSLVTKIAFPKEVFPLASVFSSLFDSLIAATAATLILLFLGWVPPAALWCAFLLGVVLIVQTAGWCLLLSAANLFYRDVKYLVDVLLTYAIFFTPVLYEASMLGRWEPVVMLNPVAPLLEGISNAVVHGTYPDPAWTTYSIVMSALLFLGGYSLFKRLEARFAESI
jgi:ABC-type polysaccharide/polyol phosphate export permease